MNPTPTTVTTQALTVAQLEQVYDALAQAIDQAGPQQSEKMLTKLALLNANALADPALFQEQLATALRAL